MAFGPGTYLEGALCLWVARIVKLHRKVSKIEACPPPLRKLGKRLDHTKGMFCAFILGFVFQTVEASRFVLFLSNAERQAESNCFKFTLRAGLV